MSTLETVFLCLTVLTYNAAVTAITFVFFKAMNLKAMLKEKNGTVIAPVTAPVGAQQQKISVADLSDGGDSYSRITGAVGSVVIASFVWALGNAVLFKAFTDPKAVSDLLSGVGTFILSSSALFAPYAFNKLSTLFPKTG